MNCLKQLLNMHAQPDISFFSLNTARLGCHTSFKAVKHQPVVILVKILDLSIMNVNRDLVGAFFLNT